MIHFITVSWYFLEINRIIQERYIIYWEWVQSTQQLVQLYYEIFLNIDRFSFYPPRKNNNIFLSSQKYNILYCILSYTSYCYISLYILNIKHIGNLLRYLPKYNRNTIFCSNLIRIIIQCFMFTYKL